MIRILGFIVGALFIVIGSYGFIVQGQVLTDYIYGSLGLLLGSLFLVYGAKGNAFVTPVLQKLLSWGT